MAGLHGELDNLEKADDAQYSQDFHDPDHACVATAAAIIGGREGVVRPAELNKITPARFRCYQIHIEISKNIQISDE